MKKLFVILILSFSLGLVPISFLAYANQSNITNYYPSPSGNYTKIRLVNTAGNLSSASCAGGTHAGTIFADPATGYLQVCKSDGTVASYPGSCFNRFGSGAACPAIATLSCPSNYKAVSCQSFGIGGSNAYSYSCCFTGQGNTALVAQGGTATTAKSGCFSIYGTPGTPPAACNSSPAGDANAYDTGCDVIYSSDMTATGPVFKRNCCFNDTAGAYALGASSTCIANCAASTDASRFVLSIPAANSGNNSTATCDALYYGNPLPVYSCYMGAFSYVSGQCTPDPCAASSDPARLVSTIPGVPSGSNSTGICDAGYTGTPSPVYSCSFGTFTYTGGACTPSPCAATNESSNGDTVPFPSISSGSSSTQSCPGPYTGSLTYSCSFGSWSYTNGSCTPNPCLPTTESSGGDTVSFPLTPSGSSSTQSCPGAFTGSLTYSCSLGSWSYAGGACSCSPICTLSCSATSYLSSNNCGTCPANCGTSCLAGVCQAGCSPVLQGTLSAWTACPAYCSSSTQTRTCNGATCGGNCGGANLTNLCSNVPPPGTQTVVTAHGTVYSTWFCPVAGNCSPNGLPNCAYIGTAPSFPGACQSNSCICSPGYSVQAGACNYQCCPSGCSGTVGCDGVCNSGAVYGCDFVCNSGKVNDVCGQCGGNGSECSGCSGTLGCDGVCNSGAVNGCDGVCNSGKVNDACGQCGGNGSECAGCSGSDPCGTYPACSPDPGCGCGNPANQGCGCGNPGPNSCGSCNGSVVNLGCGCGQPGPSGCDNQCGSSKVDQGCGCGNPGPNSCGSCTGSPSDLGCGCGNPPPNSCGSCTGSPSDQGCGCGNPPPNSCGSCTGSPSDQGCGCGNPAPNSCGSCVGTPVDLGCGCGNPAANSCGSCTGSPSDQGCGCGNPAPNSCGSCNGSVTDLGCGCGNPAPNSCGSCNGSIVDLGCGCGQGTSCEVCSGSDPCGLWPNCYDIESGCNQCCDSSGGCTPDGNTCLI